jgi:hypothetical protein
MADFGSLLVTLCAARRLENMSVRGVVRCGLLWTALMLGVVGCAENTTADSDRPGHSPDSSTALSPRFTSAASVAVAEETMFVTTVAATSSNDAAITYQIEPGADGALFRIDNLTGELRFISPPRFALPADGNHNNTYLLTVTATVGAQRIQQTLDVSVIGTRLRVEVPSGQAKTLRFSWPTIAGVSHYKLYVNADGRSGFQQVGADILGTQASVRIATHLTDWNNIRYLVEGYGPGGRVFASESPSVSAVMLSSIGYIKASNTRAGSEFGSSVALSADGKTLAVGVPLEDSGGKYAGGVYVFSCIDEIWTQQAFLQASNADPGDWFGNSVALSADGNLLAVGATLEDGGATDVERSDATPTDDAGAVYVFARHEGAWTQDSYLKASNAEESDGFGWSVALSADGETLAVGAPWKSSQRAAPGDEQSDDVASNAGAVYVFARRDGVWREETTLRATRIDDMDVFGWSVALSATGATLAVGVPWDDSGAAAGSGPRDAEAMLMSGAVYVFSRAQSAWAVQAYVKASNIEEFVEFGRSVTLSGDGVTLAAGAPWEHGQAESGTDAQPAAWEGGAGAVYVFTHSDQGWLQESYVKASNAGAGDEFGGRVVLSTDGTTLAVAARWEDSAARGVGDPPSDDAATDSGAVYILTREAAAWAPRAYLKATNADERDIFGSSVALSADGSTLAVGAQEEDGASTGVSGDADDDAAPNAGAVYVY